MKFFTPPEPKLGDRRTVRKFLLIPRCFGRDRRWLEYADVVEEFSQGTFTEPLFWQEVDFADNRTPHLERVETKLPCGGPVSYQPQQAVIDRLKKDNEHLRATVTHLQECLQRKNRELDALHYVWCSGGCDSGVHRYPPSNAIPITEDLVKRAEENTARLRHWFTNHKSRINTK